MPSAIYKIYLTIPDVCWCCLWAPSNMLHIWGTCPHIIPFCDTILQLLTDLVSDTYLNLPKLTVLSLLPGSYKQIKKSLIRHFLTAAQSVIARCRHQTDPLTFGTWACEMIQIEYLENLIVWDDDQSDSHSLIWTVWNNFCYTFFFIFLFISLITTTDKTKQNNTSYTLNQNINIDSRSNHIAQQPSNHKQKIKIIK